MAPIRSKLMELSYSDPKFQIRLTGYADTVIIDSGTQQTISAIRFGGYPEVVRALSDAIYGGASVELKQDDTTLYLDCRPKGYRRLLSHDGIYAVATLMANDDSQTEENTADDMVVRAIFQLKMEGYSQQAIANYLSSEGVLPPAAYKQQQGLKYQSGFQAAGDNITWSPVAVRAILENPIYIGTLVQGKRGTPNYKIKQMKLRSKEDWCVVEKNHAPIISEELFTSVQHLLSLDTRTSPSEDVVQPLAGMLFCADCGRAMCRRSVKRGNRTFYYYVCSTHKRSKLCSSHSISQTALEEVVLRAIQKQIEMVVDIDQLIHEIGQKSIQAAKHRQLDMSIEEKEKQITEQKEYRMRLLEAFHDDLISRTEYDMMRQRYTQRIDALQAALASLHERRQALEEGAADPRNWVAEYTKFRKIDKLTREMVAGLIRRITVSEGKQITIQFNYTDELASYQQMIAAATKEVG